VSRTDAGREFHVDGAAVLKARLPKDVLLNGVCMYSVAAEWMTNAATVCDCVPRCVDSGTSALMCVES